ncbi:hypothetical protein [Caballeronia ptereochthonis]|uniref:Uncharacterized protein n=1 Tax=Caballeronia ptereochthonis TaxID=1777144 RepID=A0A158EC94_9BURK|nr:hypothetical protein [Caballeronia ptereochthonis]SAL04340.1 hypothetical protein AWB83_07013 [Caballeronia ptereochthonis]
MPGITNIQTSSNIAAAMGAWSSFTQTLNSYRKGHAEQQDVVQAGASFVTAASALSSSQFAQAFSGIGGFATSMINWGADLQAYRQAVADRNARAQDAAFVALVGDAAGLSEAVASGVGVIAQQTGQAALATAAESMSTAAGVIGGVSAVIGFGMYTIYGIRDYFQELDNQLIIPLIWITKVAKGGRGGRDINDSPAFRFSRKFILSTASCQCFWIKGFPSFLLK